VKGEGDVGGENTLHSKLALSKSNNSQLSSQVLATPVFNISICWTYYFFRISGLATLYLLRVTELDGATEACLIYNNNS
jgi:hypothetical protein